METRDINLIVLHCSANDEEWADNIDAIKQLHTAPKDKKVKWGIYDTYGRSWSDVGYHYFIRKNGTLEIGRKEHVPGAHAKGYNNRSIGVCFSGHKQFCEEQFYMGARLIQSLIYRYDLELKDVIMHCQLDNSKTCPNFSFDKILKYL